MKRTSRRSRRNPGSQLDDLERREFGSLTESNAHIKSLEDLLVDACRERDEAAMAFEKLRALHQEATRCWDFDVKDVVERAEKAEKAEKERDALRHAVLDLKVLRTSCTDCRGSFRVHLNEKQFDALSDLAGQGKHA